MFYAPHGPQPWRLREHSRNRLPHQASLRGPTVRFEILSFSKNDVQVQRQLKTSEKEEREKIIGRKGNLVLKKPLSP